jgi:hypothetical protein
MTKPFWVYPEGHEPRWLDLSGDDNWTDPELRIMELEAEVRNVRVEVWWLRGLVLAMAAALISWPVAQALG